MSGFILKLIALATMMIDHIGATLTDLEYAGVSLLPFDPFYLRVIGRIAFPIYAFFIAEGCRKTGDIRKYLLRLALFALVSEIPFDLFMSHGSIFDFNPSNQNVFFTLALGVLSVMVFQSALPNIPKYLLTAGVFSLGYFLKTDYGAAGIILIWALYYLPEHPHRVMAVFIMMLYLYMSGFHSRSLLLTAGGAVAAALLIFYNGQKGRSLKWMFYVIYPAHLLALAIFYRVMTGD